MAPELSVFAICDGTTARTARLRPRPQAHRRWRPRAEHGRHGCLHARSRWIEAILADRARTILVPVLAELRRRGSPFVGFLYAGLMLTDDGPQVIEFNSRLGRPRGAGAPAAAAASTSWRPCAGPSTGSWRLDGSVRAAGAAVCVVLASAGYPGRYEVDRPIRGLDDGPARRRSSSMPAPATWTGRWLTAGGRVLGVTGTGATLVEARERAYAGARGIDFEGLAMRQDIAVGIA